jgi:acyl-CoA dehydrogenase
VAALKQKLLRFMEDYIYPNEQCFNSYMNGLQLEERWSKVWPKLEILKEKAKRAGLWNMFLPSEGPKLSIFEYAKLCEIIGIFILFFRLFFFI